MKKETNEKVFDLLNAAGFRRDAGNRRGWYRQIDGGGMPMASHEIEINQHGGFYYGTDSEKILLNEYKEMRDNLSYLESDGLAGEKWQEKWLEEARAVLEKIAPTRQARYEARNREKGGMTVSIRLDKALIDVLDLAAESFGGDRSAAIRSLLQRAADR